MEFFLIFILGMAMAVVVLFVLRPELFSRTSSDFTVYEMMLEDTLAELERKQEEFYKELAQKEKQLELLQQEMEKTLAVVQKQSKIPVDNLSSKKKKVQHHSPKVQTVLELALEGQDADTIAKKLGLGIGEVQLILGLHYEE